MRVITITFVVVAATAIAFGQQAPAPIQTSGLRAAAAYLDNRLDWWVHWPNAARDHDTSCVSCHTALPYGLARPALHRVLDDPQSAAPEKILFANVTKRVRLWNEVEPFYPDQTRGLPKSSESRGTESVLNAVILATRDASAGVLSDDARQAFSNMWALQFKAGELKGAWAWLNFHYEPWESDASAYFGATLAAIAVGTAPNNYAANAGVQDQIKLLREYLEQRADKESLFNRAMVLWASSKLPALMSPMQKQKIIEAALAKQHEDGGWTMSDLGSWKRVDSTPLDTSSDGYATGLIALALQSGGLQRSETHVSKALLWLSQHQDAATGMWSASSLNKQRDPATEIGKFMSDAATAYAVLALVEKPGSAALRAETHRFTPTQFYNTWSAAHPPALRIKPGDRVVTKTIDASGVDWNGKMVGIGPNPQTGPFYIEGAEPGDVLVVTLEKLETNRAMAYSGSLLSPYATTPQAISTRTDREAKRLTWTIDKAKGVARLDQVEIQPGGIELPLRPMLGCIGVAPRGKEAIATSTPGAWGGNMDYALMGAGVKIMLPVNEPGALLFLGDGHARQGEGEVAGTGLETSLDVEFTVDLIKKKNIGWPRLENDTHVMVLGSARPLLEAFQIATAELQRWLMTDYGMTERGAQTFMGQAAEYEVANVVDPSFTVVAKVRKALLPPRR